MYSSYSCYLFSLQQWVFYKKKYVKSAIILVIIVNAFFYAIKSLFITRKNSFFLAFEFNATICININLKTEYNQAKIISYF